MILLIIALVVATLLYALISGKGPKKRGTEFKIRPRDEAGISKEQFKERWERIEQSAQQGENGLKSAINDADKLLDQALRQRGFTGEKMIDRMKKAEHSFTHKESVWSAHKLRNAIAHEVHFDVVMTRGQSAIEDLKQALKDLGAL